MSAKKIVESIIEDKAGEAKDAIQEALTQRTLAVLEEKRIEVARKFFNKKSD